MAGLLVAQGERIMLEGLVNKTPPESLLLKLFQSDTVPGAGDTEVRYAEAAFRGYRPVLLDPASWTTARRPALDGRVELTYPEQAFASTADQPAQRVYGYYLVQRVSGKLVAAERFANGPYTVQNRGDQIKVGVKLLRS